ncbi:hypothetical protein C2S53_018431 [Perilla frutescens var. hirtella]|uniref:Uncharacterized protein n=1 Tax=Perilla frutescens var. hirtella TaxID=608512 RepID=A0AAD4P6L6_PERFH|nr:hypothetical protein C2S53_018431 [Perilla frutescens var. hirtella]
MEVIIATHIVKPSSPTPVTFKHHKLSSFDQIAPPSYIPLIFFYEHDKSKHHEEISRSLKQSLSETLTIFYPLAGTVKQNSFVDCNDRGAEFVEARVHAPLAQIIQNPKMEELKQLVPVDTSSSYNDIGFQVLVKTSYFDCGGISVAVCLSHKLGDAASFVTFMNAWASTCRGESSRIINPSFDLALRFPPRDPSASGLNVGFTKEKIRTKRVVFDSKKIEKLRQEAAAASASVKDPTKVEAVTALIWRSFIEANKAAMPPATGTSPFGASHAVNMRPRTVPPIPDHTFGNCFAFAYAVVSPEDDDDDVCKLRAAIRAVDDDYINKVLNGDMLFAALDQVGEMFKPGNCIFTSWRRFPVYDVDFGWGKPVWVSTTPMPYANLVVLMDTPSGDGIEAWVTIKPNEANFFQLQ